VAGLQQAERAHADELGAVQQVMTPRSPLAALAVLSQRCGGWSCELLCMLPAARMLAATCMLGAASTGSR
jgi:hypothetical protein